MNHAELITLFLSYVRTSLHQDIHDVYFGLNYWSNTDHVPVHDDFKKYLRRHHERVFCYELYHQLRNRIDRDIHLFQNIYLQSEVIKEKLPEIVWQHFEVTNLTKDFMPDFILHTPGNFSNQLVAMEVKSNPHIGKDYVLYDLFKIAEFIERFRYEQGIFLAVNVDPGTIWNMLREQREVLNNIPEAVRSQIFVMVQDMPSKLYDEFSLQSIFTV